MVTFFAPGAHVFNCTVAGNYIISCYGAGGGGGGGAVLGHSGGGGGGGAFAQSVINLSVGDYNVFVGEGGNGGTYGSGAGVAGQDTSFENLVIAKGGRPADGTSPGSGGSAGTSVGQVKDPGQPGTQGSGGLGARGGDAGGPQGGAGGKGGEANHNAGYVGYVPGGGGGGGRNLNGGNGGKGGGGFISVEPAPLDVTGGFEQLVFTTPGPNSWTAPYTGKVTVECVGGGGPGRGGIVLGAAGNGGGGAEYASSIIDVVEGVQYSFTVGAGGTPSVFGGSDSSMTDGTDTVFGSNLVVAKGGKRATTGAAGAGGSGGIGDILYSGITGEKVTASLGGAGGPSGFGSSWSGSGGAGGSSGSNDGKVGGTPGGGGGGGRNLNGGHGGAGGPGGVRISYYKSFGNVVVEGERKPIVKISRIISGVKEALHPYRIESGNKISLGRIQVDPSVYIPPYPTYLPVGQEAKFDLNKGTFNFHSGNTSRLQAALTNADTELAQFVVLGDSVGEGWTYMNHNLPYNTEADWIHSFPMFMRDELAFKLSVPSAGTGLVRSHGPMATYDTQRWSYSGWTNGTHFIRGSDKIATFSSDRAGTKVSVYFIDDTGTADIRVDGVLKTTFIGTATQVVRRVDISGLTNVQHTVEIVAKTGFTSILGANCYNPAGIIVHNVSQGGAKASGTGQDAWADMTHHVNNMLPLYKQSACYGDKQPDVVIIELGGNDFGGGAPVANITGAFHTIAQQWPNSDVFIIMPTKASTLFTSRDYTPLWEACYNLCLTYDYPMIDTQWLSGGFTVLSSNGMVGDAYGHLNVKGAEYFGKLLANVFIP